MRVSGFSLRVPSIVQSESNVHNNYYGYRCCWHMHTGRPGGQSMHILHPFWSHALQASASFASVPFYQQAGSYISDP